MPRIDPTQPQAMNADELRSLAMQLMNDVWHKALSEGELTAFTSFEFKVGSGALRRSAVLQKLNAGDLAGACRTLPLYDKARVGGRLVVLRGSVRRRAAEMRACLANP